MEFYYHFLSPPSRCAWMTLEVLGLDYTPKLVNLFEGEQKLESFRTMNPRCKVPTLKDGDFCVAESRAVAMYLCNKYGEEKGKPNLYPKEPEQRAKVDQQLFVDENLVSDILAYVNPGGILFRNESHKVEELARAKSALKMYDDMLAKHKFVATNELTIADLFALSSIKMLSTADYDDFFEYENIKRWLGVMEAMPFYEKTMKEPVAKQRALFKEKMNESKK